MCLWPGVIASPAWADDVVADESGTDWLVRTWQTEEGLPENEITDLAQSSNGFLWIATSGGLARFDGVHFESSFTKNFPEIPKRELCVIHFDRRGQLWMGYRHGDVVCLGEQQAVVYKAKGDLLARRISNLIDDASGAVYASYISGSGVLQIRDGIAQTVPGDPSLLATRKYQLAGRDDGLVWWSAGQTVGVLTNQQFLKLVQLPENAVQICASRSDGAWVATTGRLYKVTPGQVQEQAAFLSDRAVDALLEDRAGNVWIGSAENGLRRFDVRTHKLESIAGVSRHVRCLLEDAEGNIWAGGDDGLQQIRRRQVRLLSPPAGISLESARSITEEPGSNEGDSARLWVVTESGRVLRRDDVSWVEVSARADWPGGLATCAVADRDGGVWLGTADTKVYRYYKGEYTVWGATNGLAGSTVRLIFASPSGDVWVGWDVPEVVQCLHEGVWQAYPIPGTTRPERRLRAMTEDKLGRLWVGTSAGLLLQLEDGRWVLKTGGNKELASSIRCLEPLADGALLIGCAGSGVAWLKSGRLVHLNTAVGLGEDYVSQMAADRKGRLWCAGSRGLFQTDLAGLTAFAEGRASRVHSVMCGASEGLKASQASLAALTGALRKQDGEICFPLRSGIAVVDAEGIDRDPAPPQVHLESVLLDGQPVAAYQSRSPLRLFPQTNLVDLTRSDCTLKLRPNYHKLELVFCAPSYASPQNVNYRYRLEGMDETWVEAGAQRSAVYPLLLAGEYRFRVSACNQSGVWSDQEDSVVISVVPYFWQTSWFRLTMLALLMLMVGLVVRGVYQRRLRERMRSMEQQLALNQERTRIARDMHDTLGASLTQIGFLSSLASQPAMPPDQVLADVAKIAASSRAMVQQLDEIVWAVDPENDTLENLATYISQFADEFFADLPMRCRVKSPLQLPEVRLSSKVRHNLFTAVKEALNNSVRHADPTEVTVTLNVDGSWLEIQMVDNGRGFEAASARKGSGLINLRHRMEEIGGSFSVDSQPGRGTNITLRWAWAKES